jgi:hypothetical protein
MGLRKKKPIKRHLINALFLIIILSAGYIFYTIIYDLRVRFINHSVIHDIAVMNQEYATEFEQFVEDIERETDWKVSIISGLRTKKEQVQLKRDNPRNAPVNKSRHVLGRAIDLNLYKRSGLRLVQIKKGSSKALWLKTGVPEIAKRYGLLWGGTYRNYHDPVHFEINQVIGKK